MSSQHIRFHAAKNPDHPAVIMAASGETRSYGELSTNANRCARMLREGGVRPGDRIALLLENRPEFMEICWAAINSGLFFVPVSTHLKSSEISYVLSDCGAELLFCSDRTAPLVEAARGQCGRLKTVINVDAPGDYARALLEQPDEPLAKERRGAPMVYSSGTTGRPKGIVPVADPTASPLEPTALSVLLTRLYGFSEDTVYLSPAPLYHTAPLKFNLTVTGLGGTAVICERFDAEACLSYIERYRITHSQWVPTMFSRMLALPQSVRERYRYDSHAVVIHAAAPCPPSVKQAMIEWWGNILYEYYAGSESVGLCAISPDEYKTHPGSVGRAVKGTIHILDDAGIELPRGQPGTIFFEGGGDFAYHNDPEKTRSAHTQQGWSTFGDIGYLDQDGYLYLSDRRDDLIISGGVNIYPQEVENALLSHPLVADAAVIGVPSSDFGQEVKACVKLEDGRCCDPALEETLLAYCREHLSHIKCPRSIDFLQVLPRHENGKLHRRVLREQHAAGH